ncbi:hypothetical protein KY321_02690 [Candidatus Woesearchaeota archaeon]|nr:hypothetical protein [Candidatus Woesearchaeota archaeon]
MTQSENQLINGMMDLMVQKNFELSIKKDGDNVVFNLVANLGEENNPISLPKKDAVKFSYNNNDNPLYWEKKPSKAKNKSNNKQKYFTPYMTFVKVIRDKNPSLSPKESRNIASNIRKEFPNILKVSKRKFDNMMKTVNVDYYK